MTILFISYLVVVVIIYTCIFRFQRITLELSRGIFGFGNSKIQTILTPRWIIYIGWFCQFSFVLLIIWSFISYNWIVGLLIILFFLFGTAYTFFIIPFPSYKKGHIIIRNKLEDDLMNHMGSKDEYKALVKLMNDVDDHFLAYFKSIGQENVFYNNLGID